MTKMSTTIYSGILLDETSYFSLAELCKSCGVNAEVIIEMVEHGILEPRGKSLTQWQFPHQSLRRSKITLHLQHDLGSNLEGAAIAIDLLERIEMLERELKKIRE